MHQDQHARVREARKRRTAAIEALFKETQIGAPREIFLRAFKLDDELELWARDDLKGPFKRIKTYPICMRSGEIGPKRRQGDGQVPEGIYKINRYNPRSSFHLSLGLDYPNRSDQIRGHKPALGNDIFIHGDCVTIGCIPITDELIEELYLIALDVHGRQKATPVHIFPTRLNEEGMNKLIAWAKENKKEDLIDFWRELQPIYKAFEETKHLPKVKIAKDGKYSLK
ncbi:hypothetical protein KKB55_04685 [Myxococcota bacterium]|nr:hypothetical protein [Myxococcota bacterium]MBU1897050.1 hypothetical protein [Myxococcota bacterium]